ncbi:hypothetical protein PHK61_20755 [Actinomycetospora lutea]|uniref:hypothetical protein n=1 Tax=Actinomycetospora lutea TaxID=663604 RepID=UPI002366EA8B|nr:hypothetical protein [Actinomycetospora lutea]MDD7940857.1 hypothetical protein [Actinomycetospora lutea]
MLVRPGRRPAVPQDAPPAGLGYPPPTAYRRDPVTGVPTPPRAVPTAPAATTHAAAGPVPRRRAGTRAPLAVAVAGAATALVGLGAQIPGLVDAVSASAATAPAPAAGSPAVAGQCATVVADAIDETVATLGRTPAGQWTGVVAAREESLAATYGDSSREQRAYAAGVDDVMDWLMTDPVAAEDWNLVTTRVARTVATTCAS